jgi:hypothetical protein
VTAAAAASTKAASRYLPLPTAQQGKAQGTKVQGDNNTKAVSARAFCSAGAL